MDAHCSCMCDVLQLDYGYLKCPRAAHVDTSIQIHVICNLCSKAAGMANGEWQGLGGKPATLLNPFVSQMHIDSH